MFLHKIKKISTFGDDIKNGDITMDKASHDYH